MASTCCVIRRLVLLSALLFASCALAKPRTGKRSSSHPSSMTGKEPLVACDPDKLMVYKVTLATHWTRALFPKQYPEWRPPAQWSKVIGKPSLIAGRRRFIIDYSDGPCRRVAGRVSQQREKQTPPPPPPPLGDWRVYGFC